MPPTKASVGVSVDVAGCSQWVCHIESGKSFPIMPEVSSSWSGVWSPNGLTLAFFTNNDGVARLWLWSPINTTLKQATTLGARPFLVSNPRYGH
ncbi:MAG: hypothetical protein ACXVNF_06435 [Neobacillus sp.]